MFIKEYPEFGVPRSSGLGHRHQRGWHRHQKGVRWLGPPPILSRYMKVLITGSSGLIGSEAVAYYDRHGHDVHGVDNNMRREFFGPQGDTRWNLERLRQATKKFTHHDLDIRDRARILEFFKEEKFDLIVHCAAQPSHD